MDINLLIWSFLIIFMLHNFEEIIMLERWFHKIYPNIRERIPPFVIREIEQFRTITTAQFSMVVCVLFIVSSSLIISTIMMEQYFLFLGLNIFFALNILIHPIQSLLLRYYVPGLLTTLLLIIPYNIIIFYEFNSRGILDTATILKAIVVTILLIPTFIISHLIGEKWIST